MTSYARIETRHGRRVTPLSDDRREGAHAAAQLADNRPAAFAQRKLELAIADSSRVRQMARPTAIARNAPVQRLVMPGLPPGTQVIINAGMLAGMQVTIHHENANFAGFHVYFVTIPGIGQVAMQLNELNPVGGGGFPMPAMAGHNAAAPAA